MLNEFAKSVFLASWTLVAISVVFVSGCGEESTNTTDNNLESVENLPVMGQLSLGEPSEIVSRIDAPKLESGRILAKRNCCQCHLEPSPADLPNDRWPFVIAWMGHYLGHASFTGADRSLIMPQFVPKAKKLTKQELNDIEYYFVHSSENEIEPGQVMPSKLPENSLFEPSDFVDVPSNRLVTGLLIDEAQERVYVANGSGAMLLEYDFDGKTIAIHDTKKTQAVDVQRYGPHVYATLIGDMFALEEFGAVMRIEKQIEQKRFKYTYPVRNYFRLAHSSITDLNNDGFVDYCTSGFGSSGTGAFSIFYGTANDNQTRRYDLIKHCGAISSKVFDIDNDGDQDIIALTTQGFHDLWLFENKGDEHFVAKRIWKKSPSTGSTSMEAADFDGDGKIDLAILTGNNFEMVDPPIRPYHGVYVFRNPGNAAFEQAYFHPLPGAARMVVADLNNDQQTDIAAVSSLPDWRIEDPISTLILTNDGGFDFAATTIKGLKGTQWMSIAAGDVDKDGDKDLLLGAMNRTPELSQERAKNFLTAIQRQPSVLLLENQTVK